VEVFSLQDWPLALVGEQFLGTTHVPLSLGAGMSVTFQISLTVPPEATEGVVDTSIITATSQADPTVYASAADITTIRTHWTIYLPVVTRAYWSPAEGDMFYIRQRSSSPS
jgi:hypothetical protein